MLIQRAKFPTWQEALQGGAGDPGVTPADADPLMTPGLADAYETYGADETTTLGLQEEMTMDSTATPYSEHTSMPGNKAQQPQIKRDAWRFQEP